MKIVRRAPDQLFVRERPDLSRFHEHHIVRILHFSFDQQKWLLRNTSPAALKQIGRHDRIRNPRLILQTNEDKSLRRPGSLAANDVARDLDHAPMPRLDE